jgi:hypothetical protein
MGDKVHGVDAAGCYLGLVDPALAASVAWSAPPVGGDYLWAGGQWVRQRPLAEAKATKLSVINAEYEAAAESARQQTPSSEVETWSRQEAEARAWVVDGAVATPFVDGIADARGVGRVDLLHKIIARSDAYALLIASLTGQRQGYEDALKRADTTAEVEAIVVSYAV